MFHKTFNRNNRYKGYQRKTYPTHCRYCGKHVYYYENEYGSRVFFEKLGYPWPKHRCREYLNRHSSNR